MTSDEDKVKQAYTAILGGNYEEAVACFEQALQEQPGNADLHYRCSITCARSDKWSKALEHAQAAVRLEPRREVYAYHLCVVQAQLLTAEAERCIKTEQPQVEQAVRLLLEATSLDPLQAEARLLLGTLYAEQGRDQEALEHLLEALQLVPEHEPAKRLANELRLRIQRNWRAAAQEKKSKRNR